MIELALVGVPNSGKSTFFKAVTLKDVKIANYPFTTLEPNEGLAYVSTNCPCKELEKKFDIKIDCKKCIDGVRFVPVKLWDVAGLVPDAHLGKGRGNAFMDDLMQASGFIHILDISGRTNNEGNPVENNDPRETVKMLEKEIDFWLLGLIKKDWKAVVLGKKEFIPTFLTRFSGLGIKDIHIENALEKTKLIHEFDKWTDADLLNFVKEVRKESKPMIVAANKIDFPGADENLKQLDNYEVTPCSAEVELALREASKEGLIKYIPGFSSFQILNESKLNEQQKKALMFINKFLNKFGSTGVQQVLNKMVFQILDMIVVYPVENEHKFSDKKGNVLPDAYLMKRGSTAHDLAYKIHEDIGKKFITAVDARTGKNVAGDYKLKDGDIISVKAAK